MDPLDPAVVVGPGYAELPGFIPGVYSWPGVQAGVTLIPEGFTPEDVGADVSAHLAISQLAVSQGTLTPAVAVGGSLGLDSATSVGLPPDSVGSLPLTPA